jgi:hypothetical protein
MWPFASFFVWLPVIVSVLSMMLPPVDDASKSYMDAYLQNIRKTNPPSLNAAVPIKNATIPNL